MTKTQKIDNILLIIAGILLIAVSYIFIQETDKYKASQLELVDTYEAYANLIIKHQLTLDSYALCIAMINPPPQPTPTESAALFSEYVQQH